jgi:hypothetical protein
MTNRALAFFHGDVGKSRKRLEAELVAIDRDIEAYHREVDANDARERAESSPDGGGGHDGGDMAEKVAALMERRARTQTDLKRLEQSGEAQLSTTDADARLLSKSGQVVSGYNVQIAVDEKQKLTVASEVVNDGNDTGQLCFAWSRSDTHPRDDPASAYALRAVFRLRRAIHELSGG